ncbi:MAG: hypothetical protein QOI39_3536, partial [Mycobacterium sp.]|nr:hypothetical protein [Mycobacterium sp.]
MSTHAHEAPAHSVAESVAESASYLELLRLGQTSTRFQPKLTVSTPGDPLEDEADRIADAVVGDSSFIAVPRSAAPAVQRRDDETKPPDPASQPA